MPVTESDAGCIVVDIMTSNAFVASSTGKAGTRQIILDVQQVRESSTSRTTIISTPTPDGAQPLCALFGDFGGTATLCILSL